MPNINEAFPSKYLKAADLKGHSVVVQMDRVEYEAVGQDKQIKPVLYFLGKEKGIVLNKTNTNKIISITDSPVTEDWHGVAIQLYPSETTYQGDVVDCIRVKAAPSGRAPKVAPPPPPSEPEHHAPPLTDDDIPF